MMEMVVKCDKCGKTISGKKGAVVLIAPRGIFSLCDECQKILLKWLKKEE